MAKLGLSGSICIDCSSEDSIKVCVWWLVSIALLLTCLSVAFTLLLTAATMNTIVRHGLLAFVVGALFAIWLFVGHQETGYDFYASILGGPGYQQGEVTYDVSLHSSEDEMWLVSHRDFDQAESLEVLLLLGEDASLNFLSPDVEEQRESGIVKVVLRNVSTVGVEDELLRWTYEGDSHDIVLSDVAVAIDEGELELLAVYNTMTCLGENCGHK